MGGLERARRWTGAGVSSRPGRRSGRVRLRRGRSRGPARPTAELPVVQSRVQALLLDQLGVGAVLDDLAGRHHQNLVGLADQVQVVGDDDGGLALDEFVEGVEDELGGLGVQAGGGLVQDQDGRLADERAGDGQALALPAGELAPRSFSSVS